MLISFLKSRQSLLAVVLLLMFASCKQSEFYDKSQMQEGGSTPTSDGNGGGNAGGPALCENGSTDTLICNPLGGGDGSNPTNPGDDIPAVPANKLGLIAHLYEGQNQWNNLDQYFIDGYMHEEFMYFSNFDVPTRAFDEGFGYGQNVFLTNRNGEKLIEWFAIKANGNIMLPDSETSGSYHIVTISDDGIKVTIDGKTIISNTGVHAPTVDCAQELVQLNSKQEKTFELGYFQGPRVLISLQTFIKKIDDVEAFKKESFCSTGSGPDVLIQNGYKIISSAWFTLPARY
ncbi:MAG: hypothetical protein H7336_09750 [Bacteriovorax sp.]|nr:hypothetical protein [Bacteriovorax sp.]